MKRIAVVVGFLVIAGVIGFVVRLPSGGGTPAPALGAGAERFAGGARPMASPAPKGGARGSLSTATTTTVGGGGGGGHSFSGGGAVSAGAPALSAGGTTGAASTAGSTGGAGGA